MNERIKELAKQAGGEFWQRMESDGVINKEAFVTFDPPQSLEKFAELIIKDACVGLYTHDVMDIYARYGIEYKPEMRPVDKHYCDFMTVEEWEEACESGCFISDDGSGHWATATQESYLSVWSVEKPEWATHVAWYNK